MNEPAKDIIILGTGDGFEECPFDKQTWAIGKLALINKTNSGKSLPENLHNQIDVWVNMDDPDLMKTFNPTNPWFHGWTLEKYAERLNAYNKPVILPYEDERFTNGVEYPLKEIVEHFKTYYFSNSICYILALAIYTGVETIDFYGVNQVGIREYVNERKGVEFWLGMALGAGIQVSVHGPSHLTKLETGRLYGYKRPYEELRDYFDIDYA